jgi:hypothetical protein
MRVALIYSGLVNFTQKTLDNHHKFLIDNYDTDIYISSYGDRVTTPKPKSVEQMDDLQDWTSYFKTVINDPNIIARSETNPVNTLSMFYKIYRGFCMVRDSGNSYDIIVRCRSDITFDAPVNLIINDSLNVPKGGDHHGGLMDLFAYGNYPIMNMHSKLHLFIGKYLYLDRIVLHPETLLRYHCNCLNIPINRFDQNIYLRNSLFTSTAPTVY